MSHVKKQEDEELEEEQEEEQEDEEKSLNSDTTKLLKKLDGTKSLKAFLQATVIS